MLINGQDYQIVLVKSADAEFWNDSGDWTFRMVRDGAATGAEIRLTSRDRLAWRDADINENFGVLLFYQALITEWGRSHGMGPLDLMDLFIDLENRLERNSHV